MKARPLFLLILAAPALCRAQPALPPQERPRVIDTIVTASETDGIALQSGRAAPLAKGVEVRGARSIADLTPGDLVELLQDENGLVKEITVLPRLAQRRPLVEVISGTTPISRFWWSHQGEEFPDSIYTADATVPLQVKVLAFEAGVAYLAPAGEGPVTFAVLDAQDAVLWEARVSPGETARAGCPLGTTGTLTLRCRRADGSRPDHTHCVWASPTVLLQELGSVPLHPDQVTELIGKLAEALGALDPGAIAVAEPEVIGLSQSMAIDLQQDVFVALGSRFRVTGLTSVPSRPYLTGFGAGGAGGGGLDGDAVAAAELRYAPDGATVRVALVSVDGQEILAKAETTIQP